MNKATFPDGATVPVLGQGTWKMGENKSRHAAEVAALRLGIDLGMTLIDTAEMYGAGAAELLVGEAVAGQREKVFLVTKVYPHNASRQGVPAACESSLRRLKTDVIDLYLLHWRGNTPLAETAAAFERLRAEGKIRRWGVSNFDVDDLEELGSDRCATNQVLYNPEARGIEFDLLPWCQEHRVPVMAYSPVGQGGSLLKNPTLKAVAGRRQVTPAQVALAWTLRQPGVISIPKAGDESHVRENAAAAQLQLTREDLAEIDKTFAPPKRKERLGML